MQLIEIRIGEVENGHLPLEVWLGVGKNPDGNGDSAQRVLEVKVPITLPVKSHE